MEEVHLICRDIDNVRYCLCYDRLKSDAMWVSSTRLPEVKERFGQLAYKSREIAEDRAKKFGILGESKCYVVTVNV